MNLKGKFCDRPFRMLEIGTPINGKSPCFACCPSWLPSEVGDLTKMTVAESWNSEMMQKIRQSILVGNFSYCNKERCPEIATDNLHDIGAVEDPYLLDIIKNSKTVLDNGPSILNLAYDQTCNLACPSCRNDFIITNTGEKREIIELTSAKMLETDFTDVQNIILCSSGDPFASKHFRDFLLSFDGSKYPNTKIQLVTNGVLFTEEMWIKLKNIHSNINDICISLDAAHKNTYDVVRRGGNFKMAVDNVRFLSKLYKEGKFNKLRIDFVVQRLNFREMIDFVKLGKSLGVSEVYFQKIINWGTYSQEEYLTHEIYNEAHSRYEEFREILNNDIFNDPIVNLGNLLTYREKPLSKRRPFSIKNAVIHSITKRLRLRNIEKGLK